MYKRQGEAKVTELENRKKADVDVNVSDKTAEMVPSSTSTSTLPAEQTASQETVKDNFSYGDEDWQCFSEANQNTSSLSMFAADQKSIMASETNRDEVSVNVSDNVSSSSLGESANNFSAVENGHNNETDVGSKEQQDSKDSSFCMLKVLVTEDDSPTKSLDIESPAKSTTSSADWCLVSNNTEHSREEELDTVSQVTDPSLPGDCVFVEDKGTVTPEGLGEEVLNADRGSADIQENAS